MIRSSVETITPEMAEKLLTTSQEHVKNRNVADSRVDLLSDQMKSGKWRTNGEPIIFDEDGYLLDGQHRLWAVVNSKVTIETVITRGVERSTFATIDTGAGRTAGDVLSIVGEANTPILASTLGWLHRYETGKMLWHLKPSGFTSATGLALLRKHGAIRDEITWACAQRSNVFLNHIPTSVLALTRYLFSQYKPNKAHEFFDLVGDVQPDKSGTPTRTLRDWLLQNERSRAKATTIEFIAVTMKAWAAFLNGESPKRYVWRRTGAFPESFPSFPGEKESRGKAIRGFERKEIAKKRLKHHPKS